MEEENSSWVRRPKFSHTVYLRSGSARERPVPFGTQSASYPELKPKISGPNGLVAPSQSSRVLGSKPKRSSDSSSLPPVSFAARHEGDPVSKTQPNGFRLDDSSSFSFYPDQDSRAKPKGPNSLRLDDSSSFSFYPDQDSRAKPKGLASDSISVPSGRAKFDADSRKSSLFGNRNERNSKPKQRSRSPLPTTILSDAFKEARMDEKRFSTPPPSRKGSSKGLFGMSFTSKSTPNSSPLRHFRSSNKFVSEKEASMGRCLDHGGGKGTAPEPTEAWTVDLSELYLGLKFASGAHSRLYHGIYKDQPVAVKIIQQPDDDEYGVVAARLEKQFTREVTFLSHLHHLNVIKLVGACKKPPVFCIITEYLSGGSLRAFLHKLEHKSLPLPKLIAVAKDIAQGMEYIHSQGVIHRDLKPENILFDQECCVKIADFGIACEEAYCDRLAEDPGTYRWMAPEMIKHKPYGRKVDVYSFGLLLWEMATGRIPYEDKTPIQAAFAVVNKNLRPSIPAECPAALGALIEQCWALHPEKRPDFWQIVKVLEEFESTLAQDGSLELVQNLAWQDYKKRLPNWIQKLKPLHNDESVHPMPRFA